MIKSIRSHRELEVTKQKLRWLEEQYEAQQSKPAENGHVWELTLCSLKKLMNRMKEEITRFESQLAPQAKAR